MSRDKAALQMQACHPARPIFCLICVCFFITRVHVSLFSRLLSYLFLVTLFVTLCRSCCLFLSPAVPLSRLGVGFGDSVLWILSWLRPKLLRPHGVAAPVGSLPAHPLIFSFVLLLSLALELQPVPPPPPDLDPLRVPFPLSTCDTLFRGKSL